MFIINIFGIDLWAPCWAIIVKIWCSSCQQQLSTDFRNELTIKSLLLLSLNVHNPHVKIVTYMYINLYPKRTMYWCSFHNAFLFPAKPLVWILALIPSWRFSYATADQQITSLQPGMFLSHVTNVRYTILDSFVTIPRSHRHWPRCSALGSAI